MMSSLNNTIPSLHRDMRNIQFLPNIHSEISMGINFLPDSLVLETCLFASHDSTFLFSIEDQIELVMDMRRDINWQIVLDRDIWGSFSDSINVCVSHSSLHPWDLPRSNFPDSRYRKMFNSSQFTSDWSPWPGSPVPLVYLPILLHLSCGPCGQ